MSRSARVLPFALALSLLLAHGAARGGAPVRSFGRALLAAAARSATPAAATRAGETRRVAEGIAAVTKVPKAGLSEVLRLGTGGKGMIAPMHLDRSAFSKRLEEAMAGVPDSGLGFTADALGGGGMGLYLGSGGLDPPRGGGGAAGYGRLGGLGGGEGSIGYGGLGVRPRGGAAGPARPAAEALATARLTTDATGALQPEAARRVVRARAGQLRQCYEQALRTRSGLAGEVSVALTVTPAGGVREAEVRDGGIADEGLRACLLRSLRRAAFPTADGETTVDVRVDLSFEVR